MDHSVADSASSSKNAPKDTPRATTYGLKTFGCKVNTYDSGLLQQRLAAKGFEQSADQPQVFILNTCAVTAEATKEAVREIRRLKSKNPLATVVVTGCGAQVDKASFEPLPGADLIVANSHKGDLENLIARKLRGELTERVFHSNIFRKDDLEAGGGVELEHTRSFLKIQDGCNSFCSYCVIPFARGKSRSIAIPALVERVNEIYAQGAREVVLTGVHIGDYEDTDTMGNTQSLEDLIEAVLNFTKVPRFRLTSLEPVEVTDRLLDLYRDDRLCPHFHMSIQSATSRVLTEMRRKYSAEDVERSLSDIASRVPGAFVGMDVIVGFPGETEAEFQETYDRLARSPWTRLHVFPYSERPGTKAAGRTDAFHRSVIMKRADRLRELSYQRFAEKALVEVGTTKKVMILRKPSKGAQGLSRDYWPVVIAGADELPAAGEEVSVRITGYDHSLTNRMEGLLRGEIVL